MANVAQELRVGRSVLSPPIATHGSENMVGKEVERTQEPVDGEEFCLLRMTWLQLSWSHSGCDHLYKIKSVRILA